MNIKKGDRIRIVAPRKRFKRSKKIHKVESVFMGKTHAYVSLLDMSTTGFYPDEYEIVTSRRNDFIDRIIKRLERLKK